MIKTVTELAATQDRGVSDILMNKFYKVSIYNLSQFAVR